MDIIHDPVKMTAWSNRRIHAGETIALVPTMGYFHEGHLSLMRMAGQHADQVVVSLFVNPLQFGPGEDLDSYPRNFERDCDLAQQNGVHILFVPESKVMYSEDNQTRISVGKLTKNLCGADRPGHFEGVTTVVGKLFHIVKPHYAIFGKKDYQQLAVIRKMAADLNWDVTICGHPIVREQDGLARSSRNTYLNSAMRQSALCLSRAIGLATKRVGEGVYNTRQLRDELRDFISSHPGTAIDYISFVDYQTLENKSKVDQDTLLALAVNIDNKVRLIDNSMMFKQDN